MPKTTAIPAADDNSTAKPDAVERVVYAIVLSVMAIVPLLAFLFSFGNVGDLGVHLGIDKRIAYLTGPGVDLTATGMIVAATWLSYRGRTERELLRVHVLSVICALMMFGLNCGPAIYIRHYQLAAFNAVGPFLLMAMGFVGPWLLRQLAEARQAFVGSGTGSPETAPARPAAAAPEAAPAVIAPAPADPATSPAALPAVEPAAPASRTGNTRTPAASAPGSPAAGGKKTAPGTPGNQWAKLALPLWREYVDRHGEPPTAPALVSMLRRAYPDKNIPGSERSERNIRAATEELSKTPDAEKNTDDETEQALHEVTS